VNGEAILIEIKWEKNIIYLRAFTNGCINDVTFRDSVIGVIKRRSNIFLYNKLRKVYKILDIKSLLQVTKNERMRI